MAWNGTVAIQWSNLKSAPTAAIALYSNRENYTPSERHTHKQTNKQSINQSIKSINQSIKSINQSIKSINQSKQIKSNQTNTQTKTNQNKKKQKKQKKQKKSKETKETNETKETKETKLNKTKQMNEQTNNEWTNKQTNEWTNKQTKTVVEVRKGQQWKWAINYTAFKCGQDLVASLWWTQNCQRLRKGWDTLTYDA